MRLAEFKNILDQINEINFSDSFGNPIAPHFHITEVGQVSKKYIDCGGTVREDVFVNFQLWHAEDYDHRLSPSKLLDIIKVSEEQLQLQDADIEVEYQGNTIGKYALEFIDGKFVLENKNTNCLAQDQCGIPEEKLPKKKIKVRLGEQPTCSPNSGCC
ncbi:DUF6428 family protein [Aureibacter tunicatorum]|uniref:Uncharacterized protein n=1 Tax=Aureibacter tunicatorum TaxID=866807 RepID=A0AAE4BRU1_9BACT|nr:DUF6428 family protein [Aureibacter tunicatorum]MDR6238243.1 hypothetical protein [Aureibacter tunicatorum]BDD03276.1 hypothetical protein AUTU_07590 [Aureibacter tunicatorum]